MNRAVVDQHQARHAGCDQQGRPATERRIAALAQTVSQSTPLVIADPLDLARRRRDASVDQRPRALEQLLLIVLFEAEGQLAVEARAELAAIVQQTSEQTTGVGESDVRAALIAEIGRAACRERGQ